MIYNLGGTIRACTPEQTLNKLKPFLLDIFGITRIADVTGLDTIGIPVSICIRPNSRILSTSQGKGITTELADISAIMESIETWHAERIQGERIFSSYEQLAKSRQLPPFEHLFRSFTSYPDIVSREFTWLQVMDIMANQPAYVPYALIALDSTAIRPGQELFQGTSNGLAGGNTLEEAICHGLYESIERDCTANFIQLSEAEQSQRRLRLDTIHSEHNQELIRRIHQAEIELYVFEITNRFGIASFYAEIDDKNSIRGLGSFGGYGTHLSREVALSRAITEAVQSRLTIIAGSRDDCLPSFYYENIGRHIEYAGSEIRSFHECANTVIPNSFKECIALLLAKLKQQNINHVFVYDHTRPELDIAVANVIVPGLDFEWKSHRMVR